MRASSSSVVSASHRYRHRKASGTPVTPAPARSLLTSQNGIVDKKPIAQTFVHVSVTLYKLAYNSIIQTAAANMLIKALIWRQLLLLGNLIDFSKLSCCCSVLVAIACPLFHYCCCCCGCCLNVVVTVRLH